MAVATFDFIAANSGKITKSGISTYTAANCATNAANMQLGQNAFAGTIFHAFAQFDTSTLPDDAIISTVEYKTAMALSQPSGEPDSRIMSIYIGSFIGAALNGNVGEFTGGTFMLSRDEFIDGEWIDLSEGLEDPTTLVSRTGTTDIRIADESIQGGGDTSWGRNFNTAKVKCQLRVTYELPPPPPSATRHGRRGSRIRKQRGKLYI